MSLKRLIAYIKIDFTIVYREKMSIFFMLALPAFMYIFFGLMFRDMTYEDGTRNYYQQYTGSFTGLVLLNVALLNVGPVLVIYRELGFFRRLLVTPLDLSAIWISTILRAFSVFLIGYFEVMLIGYVMFGRVPETSIDQMILSFLICAFCLFSFGFMLGSFFRSSNTAFNASMLIFQPMLLLSGASFPLETFPEWVQRLAVVIPMTHVVELLGLAWEGNLYTPAAALPVTLLAIMGSIFAAIAVGAFRRTSL